MARIFIKIFALTFCLALTALSAHAIEFAKKCDVKIQIVDSISQKPIDDAELRIVNYKKKEIYYEVDNQPGLFENLPSGESYISIYRPDLQLEILETTISCEPSDDSARIVTLKVDSNELINTEATKQPDSAAASTVSKEPSGKPPEDLVVRSDSGSTSDTLPMESVTRGRSLGVVNGRAKRLQRSEYPLLARSRGARGTVVVAIVIDVYGHVISARARSGHPTLKRSSEKAAVRSEFDPTIVDQRPVEVFGVIVYLFN